jgi:hypothetical protein
MTVRNERRRGGCGCIFVGLLLLVLLAGGVYLFGVRPLLSRTAETQLERQIEQNAPTVVGALPTGTLTISDQEVNSFIAANPESLQPLDSATVSFTPGLISAELRAFGTSSTATTGLAVVDGRLVAVNPTISGPVGTLVSAETIGRALTEQLNQQLVAQNKRASDVRVEQGQLVIVIE